MVQDTKNNKHVFHTLTSWIIFLVEMQKIMKAENFVNEKVREGETFVLAFETPFPCFSMLLEWSRRNGRKPDIVSI